MCTCKANLWTNTKMCAISGFFLLNKRFRILSLEFKIFLLFSISHKICEKNRIFEFRFADSTQHSNLSPVLLGRNNNNNNISQRLERLTSRDLHVGPSRTDFVPTLVPPFSPFLRRPRASWGRCRRPRWSASRSSWPWSRPWGPPGDCWVWRTGWSSAGRPGRCGSRCPTGINNKMQFKEGLKVRSTQ